MSDWKTSQTNDQEDVLFIGFDQNYAGGEETNLLVDRITQEIKNKRT